MKTFFIRAADWLFKQTDFFFSYSLTAVSFLLLLRIYELFLIPGNQLIPAENSLFVLGILTTEILYYFSILFPVFIVFLLIRHFNLKLANIFSITLLSLLQIFSFVLTQYFATTNIPLGADFWGYSFSDISLTIQSSVEISVGLVLSIIVFVSLVILLPFAANRFQLNKTLKIILILLFIVSPVVWLKIRPKPNNYQNDQTYFTAVNKTHYFLAKSKDYFFPKPDDYLTTEEYPLYKKAEYDAVLGSYFDLKDKKPNIVFIITEGLGADFITDGEYSGFTPYIDSLSRNSLYFKNMLSTTGRTFGVLPSLLGSLPLAEKGFMELGSEMPEHHSLISILKTNNYKTRFFYGGDAGFDKIAEFLERQKTDEIIDENFFPDSYSKSESNNEGFTWGYSDGDVFRFSLTKINAESDSSYLSIYLTLSTHEPFLPSNKKYYESLFLKKLSESDFSDEKKKKFLAYSTVFQSLLYTDQSLKIFFENYSKRDDFSNTIFILTGDHRIIPIPQQTKIDRFHVPLIIYSSMLKKTGTINSVSSHLDITPTLLSLLHNRYEMVLPDSVHWLGSALDTTVEFRSKKQVALMRSKGEISDYLNENYFLSDNQLFKLTTTLSLVSENESDVLSESIRRLEKYKQINNYVTKGNKLMPSVKNISVNPHSAFEDSVYNSYAKEFPESDQLFQKARLLAFSGNYRDSRIICKGLLSLNSNFHDARTLMARTFAWEKEYYKARNELNTIIKRAPKYSDAYFVLAQVEFWDDHSGTARKYIDKAISLSSDNLDFLLFDARLAFSNGDVKKAILSVDKCLKIKPDNQEAIDLKKKILSK